MPSTCSASSLRMFTAGLKSSQSIFKRSSPLQATRRYVGSLPTAHEVLKESGEVDCLTKLKNGMSVASINNNRPTATVGVWIDSGSRYENGENNGVASLFEHLLYTGTNKRTTQQLQIELSKIGARLNSYTSRDHTAYFAECLSGDVEKVVDIIADVMRNTKLDQQAVEEQRSVLLKKLEEAESDYRATVFDNLHKTAFQGTTYAMSPMGNHKAISNLSREDIVNFADDHYKPVRMVLTGVGGVQHERLESLADKYFGDLDNEYKRKVPQQKGQGVRFTGSEFLYRDDYYPYMFGAIAVEGVPRDHMDRLALQVAATSVGGWDHSQAAALNSPSTLVQKICGNPELVSFDSFSLNYENTGLFGFYFVAPGSDVEPLTTMVQAIQGHWKHLAHGVTEGEVDKAKNQLRTNLLLSLENNTALANYVGTEVLSCGKITPLHLLERKIHYIDAAAVREAISRHIYDRDLACAGIGKTEAWPNYLMLRYGMSWWRL